jgi:CBS domain-containing protein/Tfp pilus assembly protein PilV
MAKAYDVMTRSLATVTPNTPISDVAARMRDMNIGDVLVVEDGKLRGIVTDRDLTVSALTKDTDPHKTPVEKYMTTHVVTGKPDWSLEHVAQVMGDNQVRRLPIVENDQVLGIVSLGDVAVHSSKQKAVGDSLKNISETTRMRFQQAGTFGKLIGLMIPVAVVGVALVAVNNTRQGRQLRKQLQASDLSNKAMDALEATRNALQDSQTRQAALDFAKQINPSDISDKAADAFDTTRAALTDPKTRRAAQKLARQARNQANEYSHKMAKLAHRNQHKRFLFA